MASDIWSFGLSVAELALGRYPFAIAIDETRDLVTQLLDRVHHQVMPQWESMLAVSAIVFVSHECRHTTAPSSTSSDRASPSDPP